MDDVEAATNGLDLTSGRGGCLRARGHQRIATGLVGVILIAFLTLFMLLEGPDWRRR